MSPVVERLAELRRHLDHLRVLRPRVSREALALDLDRAVAALDRLDPIEQFLAIVAGIEATEPG